jgi:DNA-directed RNA polymerase
MFSSARAIMDWLADCARVVASSGAPMKWTTPLGLPIAQPYHQTSAHQVATLAQNFTVLKDGSDQNAPVTKSRQRSAFPPNYIHSIDSTHMMMTALQCAQEGLVFAGVHDSYWTHAGGW